MASATLSEVAWRVRAFRAPQAGMLAKAREGVRPYGWIVRTPTRDELYEVQPKHVVILRCVRCGDEDLVPGRFACPACIRAMAVARVGR